MIHVEYGGRLGNNLFQYCFGRILATELGYKLEAPRINGFEGTWDNVEGKVISGNPHELHGHELDLEDILENPPNGPIHLKGYFQRYEYYKKYKTQIKNWLRTEELDDQLKKAINQKDEDVVLHMRLGDDITTFKPDAPYTMPLEYYEKALESLNFNRLFICSEPETLNSSYIKQFDKYEPLIVGGDTLTDFRVMRSFKNIIVAQSTFSWWAAFLSEASNIFMPIPNQGNAANFESGAFANEWSDARPDIDLNVDDESRYTYVTQEDEGWVING